MTSHVAYRGRDNIPTGTRGGASGAFSATGNSLSKVTVTDSLA
ncbi:hypothetical protein WMF27_43640 [Sorangium sp. So ce281]